MKTTTLFRSIVAAVAILTFSSTSLWAQVKIGTTPGTPDPSAMLEVQSANKGFLPPRVQLTSSDNAAPITSPAIGLMVVNINAAGSGSTAVDANTLYMWDGTRWGKLNIQTETQKFLSFGSKTISPIPSSTDAEVQAATEFTFGNIKVRYSGLPANVKDNLSSVQIAQVTGATTAVTVFAELSGQGQNSGATLQPQHSVFNNVTSGTWLPWNKSFNPTQRDMGRMLIMLHTTKEIYRITLLCNDYIAAPATFGQITWFVERLQ
ncbi:hypothetical protein [Arsenicibacter rosenii]|uniref:Uncharacterized protein n=1 Tax=Arsenicibacter rosenii TaxID=1750698 RepID=A0A1S2V9N9_9BACT|nr:hypothetical protein [Arsenicibacter rosenii]OIN55457.1 hypothetical protein BLX24_30430 [Arsenicibacter rosenii]